MQGDGLKRMPRAVPERANGDGLAGQQARLLPDFRPGEDACATVGEVVLAP